MDIIYKYFPDLSEKQIRQLKSLEPLYAKWNADINVISRKDFEYFYEKHVLHSLSIALLFKFDKGCNVLDVGTGGGFPGIPLAILFPETNFHLVDSIGKKIKVVDSVKQELNLDNVTTAHMRVEKVKGKFDFVVSRAVTSLPKFIPWVEGKIKKENKHSFRNGILCLKGGNLQDELKDILYPYREFELKKILTEDFFETKKIVHVMF